MFVLCVLDITSHEDENENDFPKVLACLYDLEIQGLPPGGGLAAK